MKEALKLALEALRKARRKVLTTEECHAVIMSIKEALREHAMYEVQRLGQEIQPEQIPPSAYSNTHQPEQEPRAWINWSALTGQPRLGWECESELASEPLYTTPPQRTWVGLTDDEIDQGLLRSDYAFKTAEAWRAGVVFAMTKLKEKNND